MKLTRLNLQNFRNHRSLELAFDMEGPVTYLVGPNAAGKTNILEAIYLLALVKSFRAPTQSDMIRWGEDYCRVTGQFEAEGGQETGGAAPGGEGNGVARNAPLQDRLLEVFIGNPPHPRQSLKRNNVKVAAENFIGACQIVFFHPEDLNMLYLGPDLRRRYLDILNLQVERRYYRALRRYRQTLKQRNALIRTIRDGYAGKEELAVWDSQLAENGGILIAERIRTVAFLNSRLQEYYRSIARSEDKVEMRYLCSLGDEAEPVCGEKGLQGLAGLFREKLESSRKADFRAEATTVGPHRDDLEFHLNGRPLHTHASRGEYRSLLLSLKLLELEFFRERTSRKPILLLDDVFSELDLERQKMLLDAMAGHQVVVTASHLDEAVLSRTHRSLNAGSSLKMQILAGKSAK